MTANDIPIAIRQSLIILMFSPEWLNKLLPPCIEPRTTAMMTPANTNASPAKKLHFDCFTKSILLALNCNFESNFALTPTHLGFLSRYPERRSNAVVKPTNRLVTTNVVTIPKTIEIEKPMIPLVPK